MIVRIVQFILGALAAGGGGWLAWTHRTPAMNIFPPGPEGMPWLVIAGCFGLSAGATLLVSAVHPWPQRKARLAARAAHREQALGEADSYYAARARAADRDWRSGDLPPPAAPSPLTDAAAAPSPSPEVSAPSPSSASAPAPLSAPSSNLGAPPAAAAAPAAPASPGTASPVTAPPAAPQIASASAPTRSATPPPPPPPGGMVAATQAMTPVPPPPAPQARTAPPPPPPPRAAGPATATAGASAPATSAAAAPATASGVSFPSTATLGPIPPATEPPPAPAIAPASAASGSPSAGSLFPDIRSALAEGRLEDAEGLLNATRASAQGLALAELTGLAGDHAAAAGRASHAKWLWRLALSRFGEHKALDMGAARAVAERLRTAE